MTVFDWNARTEQRMHRGVTPTMSRVSGLTGLGDSAVSTAASNTVKDIESVVKKTIMERVAIQTGVSVAVLVVSNGVPIYGQIVSAVYALVNALVGSIYKRKLSEHLADFQTWVDDRTKENDAKLGIIQNDAFTKARNTCIPLYSGAKAAGINTSADLAKVSPWWQDIVAKYSKDPSSYPAPGLGELFPVGKSGFAWIRDDELLKDKINNKNYIGLAHVVDSLGSYYGSVWYDGRALHPDDGLGDFWSNAVDAAKGTYRSVSNQMVNLVPKITNFIPPVAAVKYIVAPAMRAAGWEGTAQKLTNGTVAAGNVASSVIVATAMTAMGPMAGAMSLLATTQATALVGSSVVRAVKQPVTDVLSSVGARPLASRVSAFADKVADKGEAIARDPGVVAHDAQTVVNTLTGKETVIQADEEIEKGKRAMIAAFADHLQEAFTQLNSETYQSTLSGFLVCKMLDDPSFAAQIFKMSGVLLAPSGLAPLTINDSSGANNAGTFLPMLAAAAGGLFLLKK